MEYQGPEPADLANVSALNGAFLDWLVAQDPGLPGDAGTLLRQLDLPKRARLARVPFLLLTLNEYDNQYWQAVFAQRDD